MTQQWPDESRIDIIGTNGNTGEAYMKIYPLNETKTVQADEILSEGLQILTQRGEQYDPNGTKERSFKEVASAFNSITGGGLKGSDVCLLLTLLKFVRQNASKKYHHDSAVDAVNYAALYAETLASEQ